MKPNQNNKKKQLLAGLANIVLGICMVLSSLRITNSDAEDFIIGVLMGAGCGILLVGVYVLARTFRK